MQVLPGNLKQSEFATPRWSLVADEGMTPDDYTKAEVWAHVAGRKITSGARVEIMAYDGNWLADYLIRSATGMEVDVVMLNCWSFEPIVAKASKHFEVEFGGPAALWRVIRKIDKQVMVDKLKTESEAYRWIEITPKASMKPPVKKAA